ncbi:MAG TPA: exodeoxyribonuclease V subunit beta [Smithellaceae bacterium]|nr:exodeoxyribonuclease V subunit beta [Smithellaceae bacterium]
MKELDHLHVALAETNLIEASAGTGKTYAVACLYLRLLIEKDLLPEQILVVTFTEAATKELISRIRSRMREMLEIINGATSDDDFLNGLLSKVIAQGPGITKTREKLERALNAFDTASIFTIHSFCLRVLKENAFESGSLYDTELTAASDAYVQEIVDDFWRKTFFVQNPLLLAYLLRKKESPEKWKAFLGNLLSDPQLRIFPQFSPEEVKELEEKCFLAFADAKKEWRGSGAEIRDILQNHQGLSRAEDHYKAEHLPELLEAMDTYLAGENPFDLFDNFKKWTSSGIARGTKKSKLAPAHRFFEICEIIQKLTDERVLVLKHELILFCREKLPARKREANIRFYDDLLNDLHQALRAGTGEALGAKLRSKYKAALIDEFQDTDPVQYDIFRKIFAQTDCPLFFIGDPKQAIYSFRGADIFAYLEAAKDVPEKNRFTLTCNRRSTSRLLAAFNRIFAGLQNPFVFESIAYHPMVAGEPEEKEPLFDWEKKPLEIWFLPPGEDGKPANVTSAEKKIPKAIAAEIARLLNSPFSRERRFVPEDIAVIVRKHRQAADIADALRPLKIPCVVQSEQSVFASDEAREICILLSALADPASETKVRTALATAILGRTGDDIACLLQDDRAWERELQNFREYHQLWLNRGFMAMARSLLTKEQVRGRLLRYPDGDRRLTNLLHCLELIHAQEHQEQLGVEELVFWFVLQTQAKEVPEENQLRLESDEKAVKIITVHVSKGLEYPVVFCPYLWGGVREDAEMILFHENFARVRDFGSADYEKHRAMAQKEELSENLRLFYVALTRAKYRVYLCAGKITGGRSFKPETSPLAYLFHASDDLRVSEDPVRRLKEQVGTLSAQDMNEQLTALQEKEDSSISVIPMPGSDAACYSPSSEGGKQLSARKFSGKIRSDWRVASFTSFAAREAMSHELPDRDELGALVGHEKDDLDIIDEITIQAFPRGARAGIFFHEIFEKLDFAAPSDDALNALVGRQLDKHRYDQKWQACVLEMAKNVLSTKLSSADGAFTLGGLRKGSWLAEMEFFFPLKLITTDILSACLKKWDKNYQAADLASLCASFQFRPVQGRVRGFMDMVFEKSGKYYLVDWKSNFLGYRPEDYGQEAMKKEMERHLYPLQYLLYTVALHRYLSLRVNNYNYSSCFGGVMYVFLRGVRANTGEEFGFFRNIPPAEMIEELTDIMIASGG